MEGIRFEKLHYQNLLYVRIINSKKVIIKLLKQYGGRF